MSDDLINEVPGGFAPEEAPKKRTIRKKAAEPGASPEAEPGTPKPVRAKTARTAKPKKDEAASPVSEVSDTPFSGEEAPAPKKIVARRETLKKADGSVPSPGQTPPAEIKFVRETVDFRNETEDGPSGNQNRNGQQRNGKNRFKKNGRNNKNFRDNRNKNNFNKPPQLLPLELGPPEEFEGLLEITPKGFGFLRTPETDFAQLNAAIYVSNEMIRNNGLRHAVWIEGMVCRHERGGQLTEIRKVNGISVEEARKLPYFDELKAVNPNKRIAFETVPERYTTRTLDLVAPVGRGQRGLIVSPPRTGKTTFLQHMAEAVLENHKDSLHLMVLLIDERPEEVTEFKRCLPGAEIYASSNDGKVRDHCRLAELCIERAKRLVEGGKHVFLLMDSITRLARAYNNADKGSGRTMSGGIDARALEMPRRLFAAARNTRQSGSLTIIATALVETNSRMDDLIFQEFKGTGNMELVLNRRIAEQYVFPAVDILKSGTRREELILPENWLYKIHLIRRALAGHKPVEAMERLLFFLRKYPSNTQMLLDLKQRV